MDASTQSILEKCAIDAGFSDTRGLQGDWLVFEAHAAPISIALAVSQDDQYLIGTNHSGVGHEYSSILEKSLLCLPGYDCFVVSGFSELFRVVQRMWELSKSLPEGPLERYNQEIERIEFSSTEALRLEKKRVGQQIFRKALIGYWEGRCAVTKTESLDLLIASHIIPWSECESDSERLNVHNGILLVATLDAAFDRGLITFMDCGKIQISRSLSNKDRLAAGITEGMQLSRLTDGMQDRLLWHRKNAFRE